MTGSRRLGDAIPWLLAGFAFFTPFSIAGAHTCLALATLALVADRASHTEAIAFARTSPLAWPVLAWILANGISVAFAVDPAHSAQKLNKLALLPLLPMAALTRSRSRLRAILGALLAATAIVSAIGLAQHVAQGGGLEARNRGAGGFYMTVAGVAMIVGLLALGELVAAMKDPRPRRIAFLGIAFGLTTAALLATYTRGSWIGFAAGAIVLLRRQRTALVAFLLGAALVLALGPPEARDRFATSFRPDHPGNAERVLIWKHGLSLFADHPVTGTGLWIPPQLLEREVVTPAGTLRVHSHMHDTPLQIAVTMGIPGLLAFGALVVAFARLARRAFAAQIHNLWEEGLVLAYPAIFTAFFVNGLFEWNVGDSEILGLFYLVTGAVHGVGCYSPAPSDAPRAESNR